MTVSSNVEIPIEIVETTRLNNGSYVKQDITVKIIKLNSNLYYLEKPTINNQTGEVDYKNTTINNINSTPEFNKVLTNLVNSKISNQYTSSNLYGSSPTKIWEDSAYKYLPSKTDEEITLNYLFKYFYKHFFDKNPSTFDVTGYTLIFLYPPDLSGFSRYSKTYASALLNGEIAKYNQEIIDYNNQTGSNKPLLGSLPPYEYSSPDTAFTNNFLDYMMFAVEFSIPDQDITVSEIDLSSNQKMEFVSGFTTSGSMNVKYLDNTQLKIYHFHNIWTTYMKMVMRGDIEPDASYYDSKELDYMGSLYFLKFKPGMDLPNYIGKATGIFPKNIPVNDILGNRTENQLVMYNINYFYSLYEGTVLNFVENLNFQQPEFKVTSDGVKNNSMDNWTLTQPSELFEEFKELIFSAYSDQYTGVIT